MGRINKRAGSNSAKILTLLNKPQGLVAVCLKRQQETLHKYAQKKKLWQQRPLMSFYYELDWKLLVVFTLDR